MKKEENDLLSKKEYKKLFRKAKHIIGSGAIVVCFRKPDKEIETLIKYFQELLKRRKKESTFRCFLNLEKEK